MEDEMKKTIVLIMIGIMLLQAAACGSEKETEPAQTETGMANPWVDITEAEATALISNLFGTPEGASNVVWSKLEGDSPMVQMSFDLDGLSFVARAKSTGDTAEDISGMYYDWTVEDETTLAGWAGGMMTAVTHRYVGTDEYADLCTWYNIETGVSYSLSTTAKDLDGFDIQAVAEAIYDADKQEGRYE